MKGYEHGTKWVEWTNWTVACMVWNKPLDAGTSSRFTIVLSKFGFYPTNADPCVFINGDANNQLILTIHIDDGMIAAVKQNTITQLLDELRREFDITSSKIGTYLGL